MLKVFEIFLVTVSGESEAVNFALTMLTFE